MIALPVLLAEVLEALSAQIRAKGRQDDYCSITVQPGNSVAYDFDEDCRGIAWVRLVGANPTVSFPNADLGARSCAYSYAYTVEIGMVGPAPIMEDTLGVFVMPEDTELFEASMRQAEELEMLFAAAKAANVPEKVIGTYTPVGPEGGVMGGTVTLQVGGDD